MPRIHRYGAHRHARRAGGLPARRHPAVRAASAGQELSALNISARGVKAHAEACGFDLCGIAPAEGFPELAYLREWIARGYHAGMGYMERTAERRADVRALLPSARSVIVLATIYNTPHPYSTTQDDPTRASIARYAWGDDYHEVIHKRLTALVAAIESDAGPFEHRAYVDTGPIQERVYAQYAGLGWIGKNTCLINQSLGSWIFLSTVICDLALEPDVPGIDRCGRCTLCIEACPTGALTEPYQLDSGKCLSYLTIENKGAIAEEHRPAIGFRAYGCDICQDVCPWNRRAATSDDGSWQPRSGLLAPPLLELWERTDDELRVLLKGSPMKRAGVRRLRRNLAVSIGNSGDQGAGERLAASQEETSLDPLVQDHVAWARERLDG